MAPPYMGDYRDEDEREVNHRREQEEENRLERKRGIYPICCFYSFI
jgi:hypothetical protein